MKKIYINETSLGNIKEYGLLPDFLFKMVKDHKTSLGDNEAFPKIGEYPFDYSIIKKRFEDVSFHIKSTLNEFDEDSLMSELSSLVTECKGLEEPIKDPLEKLAENAINRLFAIPSGTINFTFKLVGKVEFKNSPRITPESDENIKYSFKDIADIDHSNKAVEKRRFINALIQGGARRMLEVALSSDEVSFADLGKLNPHLITLYKKILYINDYLLFTKSEKLDDKRPMQGSYVETHLGSDGNRSTIDAQAIIFPLLLQEAIKGIFELFSSHGLPSDRSKAMYVIKKADYILAEPWDMRFGPTLWDMIFGGIEDSNIIPYAFTNLIKLPTDEFNLSVREILADTEAGKEIINGIVNDSQYDSDYQEFTNRINARNMDKSVIADSYFTAAELDGLDIDSEESNVIEESEDGNVDYIKLIENATVDNIDFEEGRTIAGNGEELILTIKGVKIPQLLVSLVVYLVGIDVEGKPARVLNLHIILGKEIQGMGLGTKIYTKMVYEFGSLYSWDATRSNKEHIGKIFKRLDSDPKIEVTTIPKKEGGVDYLAVLKGHNIFESAEKDKALITEGWGKDKKRIIDRCVKLIKDANPTITTSKAYALERKIEDTYFHEYGMSSSLKIRKFEPMIVKILVEELGYPDCPTTSKEQNFLKSVTKCIWNYEVNKDKTPMANNSFEGNGPDNFETLYAKYKPFMEEIEARGLSLNGKQKVENYYEIIPIPDFDTANEWGNWSFPGNDREYGKLCYTTGIGQWNSFTDNGRNSCFLCLNTKTYQNYPIDTYPEDDENTPYDEYGLSMIWVFVDQNGKLVHSNTRWNHHRQERITSMPYGGKGVDESFSEKALENILGQPFEEAFKAENSFKKLTDEANEIIENINSTNGDKDYIDNIFEDDDWSVSWFIVGKIFKIRNHKARNSNLVKNENGRWELVFPNIWFSEIVEEDDFNDIMAHVICKGNGGKYVHNLLNYECDFVLPNNLWCDKIVKFDSRWGLAFRLEKDGQCNIFVPGKGLIFDDFILSAQTKNEMLYVIKSDGSIMVQPQNGGQQTSLNDILENYLMSTEINPEFPSYLDGVVDFNDNIVYVRLLGNEFKNIINPKTKKLLNFWVKGIREENGGIYKLYFDDNHVNLLNKNGKLFVNKLPMDWPSNAYRKTDKHFIIEGRGREDKENICDLNGNFLFDINDESNWVTDIDIQPFTLLEGQNHLMALDDFENTKFNLADENLNILWKQPKNKWFDRLKHFSYNLKTGLFPVAIGEKWNFFSVFENDMLYKQPIDNWFMEVTSFREKALVTPVTMNNGYSNFIDINGELMFENTNITDWIPYTDNGIYIIRDDDVKENIVDIELGNIASDEWFDSITVSEYNENIFICERGGEKFLYDSIRGMFVENKGKHASHDFSNYTDGLKEYLENNGIEIKSELIPNQLYSVSDEFPEYEKMNLVGIINGRPKYLLPEWCDDVYAINGNGVVCYYNGNFNVFNLKTLSYVFNEPLRNAYLANYGNTSFIQVIANNGGRNIIDDNCNILFKKWPNTISDCTISEYNNNDKRIYTHIVDGYLKVIYFDKKENIYHIPSRGFVSKNLYDSIQLQQSVSDKTYQIVIVGSKQTNGNYIRYNVLNKNGELAFSDWADMFSLIKKKPYVFMIWIPRDNNNNIETNKKIVYGNVGNINTGELISDKPIVVGERSGDFGLKIEKNGKYNFIKDLNNLELVFPKWADSVTEFVDDAYAVAVINGKEYTLIDKGPYKGNVVKGDVYGICGSKNELDNLKQQLIQTIKNASSYCDTTDAFMGQEAGDAQLRNPVTIDREEIKMFGYGIDNGEIYFYGYVNTDDGSIGFGPFLTKNTIKSLIKNII